MYNKPPPPDFPESEIFSSLNPCSICTEIIKQDDTTFLDKTMGIDSENVPKIKFMDPDQIC